MIVVVLSTVQVDSDCTRRFELKSQARRAVNFEADEVTLDRWKVTQR